LEDAAREGKVCPVAVGQVRSAGTQAPPGKPGRAMNGMRANQKTIILASWARNDNFGKIKEFKYIYDFLQLNLQRKKPGSHEFQTTGLWFRIRQVEFMSEPLKEVLPSVEIR
jgi:hypothetical protein